MLNFYEFDYFFKKNKISPLRFKSSYLAPLTLTLNLYFGEGQSRRFGGKIWRFSFVPVKKWRENLLIWPELGFVEFLIVSRSCGCKTSLNHHLSSSVLDSWYEAFVSICCLWFSPNAELCLHIVQEVLWSPQKQICKPKLCHVLFR